MGGTSGESRFDRQTAIVTGAGRGIGRAVAEEFARRGALVVVADNDGQVAAETAEAISRECGPALAFRVDVTVDSEVDELVLFAAGAGDRLSILVNNAGINTVGLVEQVEIADWRRVVDVNLTGPFITSRAVLPFFRSAGAGKIVNVASVAGKRISANMAASYTASKAGLIALTRHLAYEAAPWGINVNAICPGPVDAPMLRQTLDAEAVARMTAGIPAGRLTTPEDQADAVVFLASPGAAMINGVALTVDGGALLGWEDAGAYLTRRGAPPPSRPGDTGSYSL